MSDSSQHGDDPRDGAGSSADDVFATPGAGAEADVDAVVSDDQFKEGQVDDLRVAVLALTLITLAWGRSWLRNFPACRTTTCWRPN